jgi:hypothetical protein
VSPTSEVLAPAPLAAKKNAAAERSTCHTTQGADVMSLLLPQEKLTISKFVRNYPHLNGLGEQANHDKRALNMLRSCIANLHCPSDVSIKQLLQILGLPKREA